MRITGFVAAFILVSGFAAETPIRYPAPELLTFNEVVALSRRAKPEGAGGLRIPPWHRCANRGPHRAVPTPGWLV